jgi:hypothetical protein
MTTFFSYNALVSQRASGYRNTTYALAELIDNSFDADADKVSVVFLERKFDGRRRIDEVLIFDNGKGMSSKVLEGALQFGNTTNTDINAVVQEKKKGKFGYGLPNASLSQCPSIHVYSWQAGKEPDYVYLDLEELKKQSSIDIPPVSKQALPSYYAAVLPPISKSGSLVAWRRCDRLSHAKGETIIANSSAILGRLYRHLLAAGKRIEFSVWLYNETRHTFVSSVVAQGVVANDPLFLMPNTQIAVELWKASTTADASDKQALHYKKFAVSKSENKPTNEKLVDKCFHYDFEWLGRTYGFDVITSLASIDVQKPGTREGGSTKIGECYGKKEREGNISFVRAEREIAAGHFGFYKPTDQRHRWWSIEVRFDADSDDLLGVHNNKQGIEFVYTAREKFDNDEEFNKHTASLLQARERLWEELTNRIEDARKRAFKLVKEQHQKWDAEHPSTSAGGVSDKPEVPQGTSVTSNVIKQVDGSRDLLSEQNKRELAERLQEKYPSIGIEEIVDAVAALDKALVRACVLYAPSESSQLWSYTKVFDFLVVLINTKHEFYSRVLSELRSKQQEGSLTAMELFISSLAIEEEKFNTRDDAADVVEEFRTLVGVHLHNYIKRLPDNVSMVAKVDDSAGGIDD